jgi:uncharacterized protein with GYD domain
MKDIKSSCDRAEEFKAIAAKLGIEVRGLYWTMGAIDGVLVFQSPDEETATAAMLKLGASGNVHTETIRAYDAEQMKQIVGKVPD